MKEDFQKRIFANPAYTAADKIVATALCWFINRKTKTAWPSYAKLVKATGLSRDTVIEAIKKLEMNGDLRVIRRRRPEERLKNTSNIYFPALYVQAIDNPHPHLQVVGSPVNSCAQPGAA